MNACPGLPHIWASFGKRAGGATGRSLTPNLTRWGPAPRHHLQLTAIWPSGLSYGEAVKDVGRAFNRLCTARAAAYKSTNPESVGKRTPNAPTVLPRAARLGAFPVEALAPFLDP
jgi:hypothetical protein